MYYPCQEEFLKLSNSEKLVPVYKELVADLETPVSAFMKVRDGEHSYLLESVEHGQQIGRYSFIGVDYHTLVSSKNGRLKVDLGTTLRLKDLVPQGKIIISESGIKNREDIKLLEENSIDGVLIGETLMRSDDISVKVIELLGV